MNKPITKEQVQWFKDHPTYKTLITSKGPNRKTRRKLKR